MKVSPEQYARKRIAHIVWYVNLSRNYLFRCRVNRGRQRDILILLSSFLEYQDSDAEGLMDAIPVCRDSFQLPPVWQRPEGLRVAAAIDKVNVVQHEIIGYYRGNVRVYFDI